MLTIDGGPGEEGRYRFLETVHHYARQRLLQSEDGNALRDRHFEFFYTAFRDGLRLLSGPGQVDGLRRLQRDHDNIRAALEWGLSSPAQVSRGIELATALIWFWVKRGLFGAAALMPPVVRLRLRSDTGPLPAGPEGCVHRMVRERASSTPRTSAR